MGERDWAEVYDPVDGATGGHNGRVEADLRIDEQIRRAGEEGGNDLWLPHAQRRVEETRWCDGVRRDAAEHRTPSHHRVSSTRRCACGSQRSFPPSSPARRICSSIRRSASTRPLWPPVAPSTGSYTSAQSRSPIQYFGRSLCHRTPPTACGCSGQSLRCL